MTIRSRALSAVRWTAFSGVLRGILQVIQLAVLTRLLLPVEFGLAATTAAVIAIGSLVADLGLSSAYLQARNVDIEERSALFWLNLFFSLFLTALFIFLSPVISLAAGDQGLEPLVISYSIVFVVVALGQQLKCDAEKRVDFRRLAINEIVASILGVAVATLTAWIEFGAASIIYGALATAIANTTLAWLYIAHDWRPMLRVRLMKGFRFVGFGIAVVGNGFVTQIATSIDLLVGGRLLGSDQFGLYAAPRNLFMQILSLINPIVTRVGFPLVAMASGDGARVAQLYLRTVQIIAGVSAPMYLAAAVFAEPLVVVIFGSRWTDAAPTFALLALWAMGRSIMNPVGSLLLGMGCPGRALTWNIVQLLVALIVLGHISDGGSVELSAAMLGLIAIQILPGWYFLVRPLCSISLVEYCIAIARPAAISLMAVILAYSMTYAIDNVAIQLFAAVNIVAIAYILGSWIAREAWLDVMLDQLRAIMGRR